MTHPIPKIPPAYQQNFHTLQKASYHGDLALMMLWDTKEARHRPAIVLIQRDGDSYSLMPIGLLLEDDPFERFEDPTQETA